MYDYQKLITERTELDSDFRVRIKNLREKRKEIVSKDYGINVIGNIEAGRITLGGEDYIQNFRILRMIGLRWNLSDLLGEKVSDELLYSIGVKLGKHIVSSGLVFGKTVNEFVNNLAIFIEEMKIGKVSIVKWEEDFPEIIKVDECITCAGMMNIGCVVCHYEGGVIGGAFSEFLSQPVIAVETKCWGRGDETCQFELKKE